MSTVEEPMALQVARRNGYPEVAVIAHELLSAASGHPIVVSALDDTKVLLRLATPDEVQQFERDARASLEADGITFGNPLMTRQRAEQLAAPLPVDW